MEDVLTMINFDVLSYTQINIQSAEVYLHIYIYKKGVNYYQIVLCDLDSRILVVVIELNIE